MDIEIIEAKNLAPMDSDGNNSCSSSVHQQSFNLPSPTKKPSRSGQLHSHTKMKYPDQSQAHSYPREQRMKG